MEKTNSVSEKINPKNHNIMMPVEDRDEDGMKDQSVQEELSEDVNDNRGK